MFGARPWSSHQQAESVLTAYSEGRQQKLIHGEYQAWAVNTKLRKIYTFLEWCVSEGVLDRASRNLKKATSSYATNKGGQRTAAYYISDKPEDMNPKSLDEPRITWRSTTG